MRLFRSEEDIDDPRGEVFSVQTCWRLAQVWYGGGHRRRTPAEAEEALASVGLTGDFWRLTTPQR